MLNGGAEVGCKWLCLCVSKQWDGEESMPASMENDAVDFFVQAEREPSPPSPGSATVCAEADTARQWGQEEQPWDSL